MARLGTQTATALGAAQANTCTPNCAAGHFRSCRMTATASKLTTCGKARYHATLTIVYPGARLAGVAKRDVQTLGCWGQARLSRRSAAGIGSD